ncbi:LamG domain-containing protein [archaeon]|jgi:hypothetical protein|nr:LamG domain-containing protein [archaeon]MBT4241698.1 LamG domain-containing protein [archaeon]MBT4418246.1 LamG domain-containing protein [archaeon]
MEFMNFIGLKKGQANVIVIVLLILISLVAVIIFWNLFRGIDRGDEIDTAVLNKGFEIEEFVLSATGSSRISIRNIGGNVDGIRFVFNDIDGKSFSKLVEKDLPAKLESVSYYFGPAVGINKIESVSVFPVLNERMGIEVNSVPDKELLIPENIISWWDFRNEQDLAGNNDLSLFGGVISKGVLKLNMGDYASVGNNVNLNFEDSMGFSFWIKPEEFSGSVLEKGENYKILILENGFVRFSYVSNGNEKFIESYVFLEKNKWNHVVFSIDVGGLSKIYINGDVASIFNEFEDFSENNERNLLIGKGFKGEIDEMIIFEKPLSQVQVDSLYNGFKDEFE